MYMLNLQMASEVLQVPEILRKQTSNGFGYDDDHRGQGNSFAAKTNSIGDKSSLGHYM